MTATTLASATTVSGSTVIAAGSTIAAGTRVAGGSSLAFGTVVAGATTIAMSSSLAASTFDIALFELLSPLRNVPPHPGTRWRANFYRMDHDGGRATSWDWARVGPSFHEFARFGTLVFEGAP